MNTDKHIDLATQTSVIRGHYKVFTDGLFCCFIKISTVVESGDVQSV